MQSARSAVIYPPPRSFRMLSHWSFVRFERRYKSGDLVGVARQEDVNSKVRCMSAEHWGQLGCKTRRNLSAYFGWCLLRVWHTVLVCHPCGIANRYRGTYIPIRGQTGIYASTHETPDDDTQVGVCREHLPSEMALPGLSRWATRCPKRGVHTEARDHSQGEAKGLLFPHRCAGEV